MIAITESPNTRTPRHLTNDNRTDTEPIRISIVIPTLNQAPTILDTLKSLQETAYNNLEIIVVDGQSSDETVSLIHQFFANHPSMIYQLICEPDKNQAEALNKGFLTATGEWISWLNGDDRLYSGALYSLCNYVIKKQNCQILYGYADFIDTHGQHLAAVSTAYYAKQNEFLSALGESCFFSQPTVFFKRSLLNQIGLLDTRYRYAFDYDFYFRLAQYHRWAFLPERIAQFRLHPNSQTSRYHATMVKETQQIVKHHLGYVSLGALQFQFKPCQQWLSPPPLIVSTCQMVTVWILAFGYNIDSAKGRHYWTTQLIRHLRALPSLIRNNPY